jgi:hypothetical protein
MHIVTRPREEIITVKFQGKVFEVRMGGDGAYVPANLGEYMVAKGLVSKGHHNDPPPQWVDNNGSWGDRIDPYASHVKEVPLSDVDETATPAAVAAILGRKTK